MKKNLYLPILFLLGCSSAQTIKVNSNPPGADVYIKMLGRGERKNVGKTPMVQESLATVMQGPVSGAIYIEIEKENYQPATILVTDTGSSSLEVSQELKPLAKDASSAQNKDKDSKDSKNNQNGKDGTSPDGAASTVLNSLDLNKGLEDLFEAQRLARVGRLEDALKLLDDVGKGYPQLAAVHEMKGGIFYLQKDYKRALDEYKKTVSLNLDNVTAQQMIKRLESQLSASGAKPTPTPTPTQTPEVKKN